MQHDHTAIVHSLGEAIAALAEGEAQGSGVVLVSGPGAALYAGCGWWRALVEAARAVHPNVPCTDVLDCADGTGQALAALRVGLTRLVLWPAAPGRAAAVAIAESLGGFVMAAPPAATVSRAPKARRGSENNGRGNGDKSRSPG